MIGIRQYRPARPLLEECLDGLEALSHGGVSPENSRILAVFPFTKRNPYLQMLYSKGLDYGFATVPVDTLESVEKLPVSLEVVVHCHWVRRVFKNAKNARDAASAANLFLQSVERLKNNGRQILWTVHNIVSHDTLFPDEEIYLRTKLAALVDHLHIMNPETPSLCAPHYQLDPAKIFQIPHPAYTGVYGDYVGARQARLALGLRPEDKMFLLFGSLGPYKGARQFLSQLDALQQKMSGQARVVIAGEEGETSFLEDMRRLTAPRTDVQLHLGHISDRDVHMYFRAADVAVCAHTHGLNSGVAATALTLGCPVVLSGGMASSLEGASEFCVAFDPANPETLVDACVDAYDVSQRTDISSALEGWAQRLAPAAVSERFFAALADRV